MGIASPRPFEEDRMSFGMKKVLDRSFEDVVAAVPGALGTEGFGVLTEIDVQKTLQQKLGVPFRRYRILGACNPTFAHRALTAEIDAGVMLPCNVVLYEEDDGRTVVHVVDPMQTLAGRSGPLRALADEVRQKLERVLERLG
jgi:uncharacterized protein (DUF302 family)